MALNLIYETKEAIPAEALPHYTETDAGDGKKVWTLQGEGFAPVAKVNEFRETNRKLMEAQKRFEGIDPEVYKTLLPLSELQKEGKLLKVEEAEAKFQERLKTSTAEHTTKLTAEQAKNKTLNDRIATLTINDGLLKAAQDVGIAKGAGPDIISRGRAVFRLNPDTGALEAFDEKGNGLYNAAGEFITPADYVKKLAVEAPHLFAPNSGSGAGGGDGKGGGTGSGIANPWDPKTLNITEQGLIFKKDPAKAAQLAKMHGKVIPGYAG